MDGGRRFFDCDACREILCFACCIMDHRQRPLHLLKEWTGVVWEKTTLAAIGLIYQLGHDGLDCNSLARETHSTKVVHTTGVQTLHYQFYACGSTGTNVDQLAAAGFLPLVGPDAAAATCDELELLSTLSLE
ncbi:hypothetical protein C8R43DRAFT_1141257 [Mycena crocata]|nr:hypothetical protein C8R43DRAFT_1141257 [Mycena crocata]